MADRTTIVVVEDDDEQRELLCTVAVEDGYQAVGFPTGDRLLKYLRSSDPSTILIVLDLMLPPPDGWQLLREIKSEPKLKDIPVVIASAAGDQEQILRYAGISAFLVKPFSAEDFLDLVRLHCKRAPRKAVTAP